MSLILFPNFKSVDAVAKADTTVLRKLFIDINTGQPLIVFAEEDKNNSLLKDKSPKVRDSQFKDIPKPWAKYFPKAQLASVEAAYLYSLPFKLGSGNYANLGTFRGASAACLALGLKDSNNSGLVYAIDLWDEANPASDEDDKGQMIDWFNRFDISKYLKVCQGWTFKFAKIEAACFNKFKLVFVDADHSFFSCLLDYRMWWHMVEPGGIMAFHDCDMLGVHAAIEAGIKLNLEFEEIEQFYSIRSFIRKS